MALFRQSAKKNEPVLNNFDINVVYFHIGQQKSGLVLSQIIEKLYKITSKPTFYK